jgi:DNA-directed RNA polymerase sigma subunit (sigma70/sigma32)
LDNKAFVGELSLGGEIRPVRGVLPMAIAARDAGFTELFVPPENAEEAAVVAKMLESARTMAQAKKPAEAVEEDPEEQQAVEDTAYFQMRQRISELLSGLDETDSKLLTLRFGLEGGKPLNPEETGRKLGLTPEEVISREAAALAKLRDNG